MAYYGASPSSGFVTDVGVDGRGVELFVASGGQGLDGVSSKHQRVFSIKLEALSVIWFMSEGFFIIMTTV